MDTSVPVKRTHEKTVEEMKQAKKECNSKKTNIDGVKGPSMLMHLKYYDLIKNQIPDPMHAISGIVKQYIDILMTSVGKEYYIGSPSVIKTIIDRMMSIQAHSCFPRDIRPINYRGVYKAKDWFNLLIFYILPCLKGLIPQKYLDHLAMLVKAIYILMEDNISEKSLNEAENLLLNFVVLFQEYFSKASMNFNVHLLLHMAERYIIILEYSKIII